MWEEGVHIYVTPGVHNNFSNSSGIGFNGPFLDSYLLTSKSNIALSVSLSLVHRTIVWAREHWNSDEEADPPSWRHLSTDTLFFCFAPPILFFVDCVKLATWKPTWVYMCMFKIFNMEVRTILSTFLCF